MAAPIQAGETVGRAIYLMDGKEIGEVALIAQEEVKCFDFIELFKIALKNLAIF